MLKLVPWTCSLLLLCTPPAPFVGKNHSPARQLWILLVVDLAPGDRANAIITVIVAGEITPRQVSFTVLIRVRSTRFSTAL